ncbi:hypothetical protein SAMN05216338_109015 [Bradyrhizobium sp. Rc2d]|nr:hypothetical protein SAMN05216338_109015 [Bradyrhizobium sp. Rc2d]
MKRCFLVFAAVVALSAGEITAANALDFDIGPGGVYVGPHRHRGYYYDRDRYYGSYNRYGGDSCEMWQHECARSYGGGYMYERCMSRPAAVIACGR